MARCRSGHGGAILAVPGVLALPAAAMAAKALERAAHVPPQSLTPSKFKARTT